MPRPLPSTATTLIPRDQGPPLRLPLFGPARLEWHGRSIRLRRKSLAILYYLAVVGATRRHLLADLLWQQLESAQNLRVELHHLRKTLTDFGIAPFADNMDPLALPGEIQLDRRGDDGEMLEGLEGLSPLFQEWLEEQRAKADKRASEGLAHRDLVEEVAGKIRLPYLLIVSGEPTSGLDAFVSLLATRLGLPRTEELPGSGGKALRFLAATKRFDDGVVEAVIEDRTNLWVVERPKFGEDSAFLLKLRERFAPERLSYLELPALGWKELRSQLPSALSFREAAELYTYTGGRPGFLREVLALGLPGRLAHSRALPQRIRAAYQLEARRLTLDARFALERASVHPGPLSDGMLRALGVEPYLVELERRNWFVLDESWRFEGHVSRTAIYLSLPKGQSRLYHLRAAEHLESVGSNVAAAYHRSVISGRVDWPGVVRQLDGWSGRLAEERAGIVSGAEVPVPRRVTLRGESPLLESRLYGDEVEAKSGELEIVRRPFAAGPSGAEWQLLVLRGVLHLRGYVYARNSLDVGLGGDAPPLKVEFLGPVPRTVIFAPVERGHYLADGTLLLPLDELLDCYLEFEDSLFVRLTSSAEAAVIDLTLTAYSASPANGGRLVNAFGFAGTE